MLKFIVFITRNLTLVLNVLTTKLINTSLLLLVKKNFNKFKNSMYFIIILLTIIAVISSITIPSMYASQFITDTDNPIIWILSIMYYKIVQTISIGFKSLYTGYTYIYNLILHNIENPILYISKPIITVYLLIRHSFYTHIIEPIMDILVHIHLIISQIRNYGIPFIIDLFTSKNPIYNFFFFNPELNDHFKNKSILDYNINKELFNSLHQPGNNYDYNELLTLDLNKNLNYAVNNHFPMYQSQIIITLTAWQYWWWMAFIFIITLFNRMCIKIFLNDNLYINPNIYTPLKSNGRWGDLFASLFPIFWCTNILINSNFILKLIESHTESSVFTLRVRGKQWYWVYKTSVNLYSDLIKRPVVIGRGNVISNYDESTQLSNITKVTYKNKFFNKTKNYNNEQALTRSLISKFNTNKSNGSNNKLHLKNNLILNSIDYRIKNGKLPSVDKKIYKIDSCFVNLCSQALSFSKYTVKTVEKNKSSLVNTPDIKVLTTTLRESIKWTLRNKKSRDNLIRNYNLKTILNDNPILTKFTSNYIEFLKKNGLNVYQSLDYKLLLNQNYINTNLISTNKQIKYNKFYYNTTNYKLNLFKTLKYSKNDRLFIVKYNNPQWYKQYNRHFYTIQQQPVSVWNFDRNLVINSTETKSNLQTQSKKLTLKTKLLSKNTKVLKTLQKNNKIQLNKFNNYLIDFNIKNWETVQSNKNIITNNKMTIKPVNEFFKKKTLSKNRLISCHNSLLVPTKTNLTVITNSFDVVHSWFIPGLGVKFDCVPGRSTHYTFRVDKPGVYFGHCAEVCGRFHHHMPIKVIAVPMHQFLYYYNVYYPNTSKRN